MFRRAAVFAIMLAASAGCSLFGSGETPQQKFLDALNRGNSAQASQIWLTMTPEDRNRFRRGEGLTPAMPPDQVAKVLNEQGVSGDAGSATIAPNSGATLLDLQKAAASAPPATSPPASAGP
jgi:hypothetical protein